MSEQAIDPTKRVDETWREIDGYVCALCGSPARVHPQTNYVWGCLACGVSTASVSIYFCRRMSLDLGLLIQKGNRVSEIRADVLDFAIAMEEALRKHDADRGERSWVDPGVTDDGLLEHLREEVDEVDLALRSQDCGDEQVEVEAPDVGNMAMMLFIRARERRLSLEAASK